MTIGHAESSITRKFEPLLSWVHGFGLNADISGDALSRLSPENGSLLLIRISALGAHPWFKGSFQLEASMAGNFVTSADELRRLLGDVDDATLAAVFALQPSWAEIEEAVRWLDGNGYLLGGSEWPLGGKIGAIYDLLATQYEEDAPLRTTLH